MSRLRSVLACLLLVIPIGATAAAEVHPRLVCAGDACSDDGDDQQQPCGDDCGTTCACCVASHLVKPAPAAGVVLPPAPTARPWFAEPTPLISCEGSDVFHVPKAPLA